MKRSPITYTWNGEFAITYQTVGEGPIDLVYLPPWCSNLDEIPREPAMPGPSRAGRWNGADRPQPQRGGVPSPRRSAAPSARSTVSRINRKRGDERTRTADPLLAKQVLYQLSYVPSRLSTRERV